MPKLARDELTGEWWVLADGHVIFADGDIGADNHHTVVCSHAFWEVVEALEAREGCSWCLSAAFRLRETKARHGLSLSTLRNVIKDQCDRGIRERQLPMDASPDPLGFLSEQWGIPEVSLHILTSPHADTSLLAIRHWGWIRLKSRYVTLWRLTKRSLKQLAEGLYEAHGEELHRHEFYLEEAHDHTVYPQVPWAAIDGEDVGWIRRTACGG